MVSYYATETELEAFSGKSFTATSPVTSSQVVLILTQMSARLDGLVGQSEQNFGDDSTCPEWVKQAVIAASDYFVHKRWIAEEPDQMLVNSIIEGFFSGKDTDRALRMSFFSERPNASGDW